ncbi:MAG: RAD55 family ATPase [Candidatus Thorarchaeota archaeon]
MLKITSLRDMISQWNQLGKSSFGIPSLDRVTGGLRRGYLYSIFGDSGVGKTWFCLQIIKELWTQNSDAQVLYSDFSGHLRGGNVKKIIQKPQHLEQISIVKPESLVEQVIFFRKFLYESRNSKYDLVVLDTLVGSPLDAAYFMGREKEKWITLLADHLLDLKILASQLQVPIIFTNHLLIQSSDQNLSHSHFGEQYAQGVISEFTCMNCHIVKDNGSFEVFFSRFGEHPFTSKWNLAALTDMQ